MQSVQVKAKKAASSLLPTLLSAGLCPQASLSTLVRQKKKLWNRELLFDVCKAGWEG